MDVDTSTDLLLMVGWGVLFWLIGLVNFQTTHPIHVPMWLSSICGKGRRGIVYLRPFALQAFGVLVIVLSIILALLVRTHSQRVELFSLGNFVFLILAGLLVAITVIRQRPRKM